MISSIIAAVLPLLMLSLLVDAFINRSNKISPFQQRVQQSSKIKMTSADIGRNLRLDVDGGVLSYDFFVPTAGSSTSSSSSSALGSGGTGPIGIAYLPGLVRPRNEAKSINLQTLCRRENLFFLGADYFGVGRSSGKFSEGSIGRWTNDTILLIDKVLNQQRRNNNNKEKLILVGHGMGTWISFLIALRRPDLVAGIVGLSADPDFTEELLWKSLSEDIKQQIMTAGSAEITWGKEKYPITKELILDGRKNLLLAGGRVRLLESCASTDAALGAATHLMEGEQEFKTMRNMITEVLEACKSREFDLRSPGSG
eukprot:gene26100-34126_t